MFCDNTELKLFPVIVTCVFIGPLAGVNEVITGAPGKRILKPLAMAVPLGVVTTISPDRPPPITAEMLLFELTVNEAAANPPKVTELVRTKPLPVIVMVLLGPTL